MALINCPDCNTEVSDKAFQCPKCAYPISSLKSQNSTLEANAKGQNVTINVQQPNLNQLAILSTRKSEGLAFLLIFLFGPFGLLYANPKKANAAIIWMIFAIIFCAFLIKGEEEVYYISVLIGIVFWIISIVIGMDGVNEYNRSLLHTVKTLDVQSSSVLKEKYSDAQKAKVEVNDDNYKSVVVKLHTLISSEKKKIIGGNADEIFELLYKLCKTREDALLLLNAYSNFFGYDLIKDLKDLNSSYNAIRRNLSKFIELEIVEENYPHTLKV